MRGGFVPGSCGKLLAAAVATALLLSTSLAVGASGLHRQLTCPPSVVSDVPVTCYDNGSVPAGAQGLVGAATPATLQPPLGCPLLAFQRDPVCRNKRDVRFLHRAGRQSFRPGAHPADPEWRCRPVSRCSSVAAHLPEPCCLWLLWCHVGMIWRQDLSARESLLGGGLFGTGRRGGSMHQSRTTLAWSLCIRRRLLQTPAGGELSSRHGSGEDVIFLPRREVAPGRYMVMGGNSRRVLLVPCLARHSCVLFPSSLFVGVKCTCP